MKLLFPALGCLFLLYRCDQAATASSNDASRRAEVLQRYYERTARNAFVEDNTAFARDLYQQLRTAMGDLFLSPHSISTALAMTYTGARQETERQMAKALHFTFSQAKSHPVFAELQTHLNQEQSSNLVQLLVANSLWPDLGLTFKRDFLDRMEKNYQPWLTPLNYGQTEAAPDTINRWVVVARTRDQIKERQKPGKLSPATVLVLVNAIYYNRDWASPPKPEDTRSLRFHLTSSNQVNSPPMHQSRLACRFYADTEVESLELPYKGRPAFHGRAPAAESGWSRGIGARAPRTHAQGMAWKSRPKRGGCLAAKVPGHFRVPIG